ncbi:MAG: ABC transporter permease [Mariprofundaceae bacterium]|nr:ABC transporter permease [Mariprofundaceae bacterium]
MKNILIYLRLGLRNLLLYPMRTGLTVIGLGIGIAALTFLSAMNDGWLQNMKLNFVLTQMGHVQIHAQGFEQSRRISDYMGDTTLVDEALQSMQSMQGGIQAWSHRIRVSGLASAAGANASVLVSGIEPEREKDVSRLHTFMQQGTWLQPGDKRGVVLGDVLADRLSVGLGDKVVLMAASPDGDIASEVFRVRGLIHSGVMDVDNLLALIPLKMAQHWLHLGAGVTDVVIRTNSFAVVDSVVSNLQQRLSGKPLEILRWQEIDPMAEQWTMFAEIYTWVVLLVVIIVVLAEVLNTMLMSMHDRVREFGLMAALGTTQQQLFAMVVYETLVLVFIGGILGFLLGGAVSLYYGEYGLDLSQYATAFSFMYMSSVVYPELTFNGCARILVAAMLGAVLAGLYPAWKASRLNPAQAMREI